MAQTTAADATAKLQAQVAAAQSGADNAWMLTSAALVLMMTGPGLALFYGGLVRKKNVLGTMMQSFAMMAIVTVLWAFFTYSLAFDSGTSFIGGLHHLFLKGVGLQPDPDYSATIPLQTYMVYQLMFAIITPALITGAFAERMKFSAMALFLTLWSIVVYSPMAHMVWGKGGLLNASLGGKFPTLDFAGGTVVHVTSGVSALVCALYLGKRLGYPKEATPPHSVVLSFVGACLLWVGWFGFNAGSALNSGTLATSAFVNTHFGAAAAALGWMAAEWIRNGKPSALGGISGAVAGLVAITPAAGFVQPMSALVIGAAAGVFCYFMVFKVKNWFGYDDSLDAFGVHGAGGTLGAVLTGVFASSAINPIFKDAHGNTLPSGAVDGNWHQVLNQLVGIAIAWVISIVGTLVLLKVVDLLIGLRVPREHEVEGLDLTQHGEEGYDFAS
ncbi:ammonium transporter [Pseudacidobacterium ailaaui]|uniref:ammonium transporter n=1 Tax=Pseudacidobacterium ailaaui TaxID=1382359 RepID=UPI0012DD79CE|nr:ammonium transporter [Pseudacidobacterium ailaaui]MBX6361194.1 ammonium transporter [Pseudacidobacterium ailaaui]MCL6463249.1 ammonium transporter [Pseudacidobacterium ailaaui]MDI3254699.1 ammonium transporter [Bacillota bacterium]